MKKLQIFSALLLSATLAACGGGDPESASDKPNNLLPDDFVPPASSSSSSSSASNIVNETIPFHENFDNAVNTRSFFSADYKALNTDTELPFYYSTGGFLDEEGNPSPTATSWITADDNRKLQIGNGRFTLGQTRLEAGTTTADANIPTWGEFNLSKPYKLSFCVVQVSSPSGSNFEVYVDNNTTGGNNSRYGAGNASRILQVATHTLVPGQRQQVTVPATEGGRLIGTETSFFQFRVSSGGWAVVDDVVVEYVGEPHGLSLPDCVAEESTPPEPEAPPATPNAPTLLAGDSQITVGWTSVGNQTTYDILYNTVDSLDGALSFAGNPISGTSAVLAGLANNTTYYVFVRATNAIGSSEYSESSSATPEVAIPSTGTALPFTVNLNASKDAFFGTNDVTPLQALTNYPDLPMYFVEGGGSGITLDEAEGTITLANGARFTIGQVSVPAPADTTGADTTVNGDLDLSQPYMIIINVVSASDTGNFQVYVDNNTTGQNNSVHGGNSRIYSAAASTIADGTEIRLEVGGSDIPYVGTANSFVQLRTDSSVGDAGIVIGGIRIEQTSGGSTEVWTAEALALVGTADIPPSGSVMVNEESAVTLTAAGGSLSSSAHQLYFAHQQIEMSDFVFTARIASVEGATIASSNSYRFGLMVMSDLDTQVDYTNLAGWADVGFYFNGTTTLVGSRANMKPDGSRTRTDINELAIGHYFRIEVYDDGVNKRVRRLTSTDGVTFTQANSTTDFKATSETDSWYVGFYGAPGENEITVEFDNISIEPYVAP